MNLSRSAWPRSLALVRGLDRARVVAGPVGHAGGRCAIRAPGRAHEWMAEAACWSLTRELPSRWGRDPSCNTSSETAHDRVGMARRRRRRVLARHHHSARPAARGERWLGWCLPGVERGVSISTSPVSGMSSIVHGRRHRAAGWPARRPRVGGERQQQLHTRRWRARSGGVLWRGPRAVRIRSLRILANGANAPWLPCVRSVCCGRRRRPGVGSGDFSLTRDDADGFWVAHFMVSADTLQFPSCCPLAAP
jgi:hypothetical protein